MTPLDRPGHIHRKILKWILQKYGMKLVVDSTYGGVNWCSFLNVMMDFQVTKKKKQGNS